jgi:hypothetical protein
MRISETRGQMEAASGLMRIDPLLDDELVSLVASFPQECLLQGDRQRGLQRLALQQVLPESVRMRPTKARFEPAIASMVRVSDLQRLRELANMRTLHEMGLVEPRGYQQHFETVLRAGALSTSWLAVWPALSIEAFVRACRARGPMRAEIS